MDKTTCSVDDCGNSANGARGWCRKHYARWKRNGDPLKTTRNPPTPRDAVEKYCPRCDTIQPIEKFGRRRTQAGFKGYCHDCERGYDAAYAATESGRESRRLASLKWSRDNREYRLRLNYGIGVEDYDRMALEQGGRCAICATGEPGSGNGFFAVDHCHTTNEVRGLLCTPCNMAIGLLNDDPVRLASAITYLAR